MVLLTVLLWNAGYKYFGLRRDGPGLRYREWAPGNVCVFAAFSGRMDLKLLVAYVCCVVCKAAIGVSLVGDFNFWDPSANRCERDEYGVWSCYVPDLESGMPSIPHLGRYKSSIELSGDSGGRVDRIPAWADYVVQV